MDAIDMCTSHMYDWCMPIDVEEEVISALGSPKGREILAEVFETVLERRAKVDAQGTVTPPVINGQPMGQNVCPAADVCALKGNGFTDTDSDASGFALRDAWITRNLLHDGGRIASWLLLAAFALGGLRRPGPGDPPRRWRWAARCPAWATCGAHWHTAFRSS